MQHLHESMQVIERRRSDQMISLQRLQEEVTKTQCWNVQWHCLRSACLLASQLQSSHHIVMAQHDPPLHAIWTSFIAEHSQI